MNVMRYILAAVLAVAMSGSNQIFAMSDCNAAQCSSAATVQDTQHAVAAIGTHGQEQGSISNVLSRLGTRWGLAAVGCALFALSLGGQYYSCLTTPSYYYQASQCPRELDYRFADTSIFTWAPSLVTKLAVWGLATWLLWHKAGKVVAARNGEKRA
jgi:hypothetical protein